MMNETNLFLNKVEFFLYFLFPILLCSSEFRLDVFGDLFNFGGGGRTDFRELNVLMG